MDKNNVHLKWKQNLHFEWLLVAGATSKKVLNGDYKWTAIMDVNDVHSKWKRISILNGYWLQDIKKGVKWTWKMDSTNLQ
jgi:hypothetical protein